MDKSGYLCIFAAEMRERLLQYLRNRRFVELLLLGCCVFVVFFTLVFTPFRIHDWVQMYRIQIMWVEMGLLAVMIWIMLREILSQKERLDSLSEQEMLEQSEQTERYNFYDEKGDLKLSVKSQMLYYLEGADNYVLIHYISGDKKERMMIRNTLKNIEWRFHDRGLVRCHRSYIVNVSMIKLLKRIEGEVFLDFGDNRIGNIPVSKGYGDKVIELFT